MRVGVESVLGTLLWRMGRFVVPWGCSGVHWQHEMAPNLVLEEVHPRSVFASRTTEKYGIYSGQ